MKLRKLLPIVMMAFPFLVGCGGGGDKYTCVVSNKAELESTWYSNENARSAVISISADGVEGNAMQEVIAGNLTLTGFNTSVVTVSGLTITPAGVGTTTIVVKYRSAKDVINITISEAMTAITKYGVEHLGTLEDPLTNEDAVKIGKWTTEAGNDATTVEEFYIKGTVESFYHYPGTRSDKVCSWYLEPATEGGEQFEIYKCVTEDGAQWTEDDIWVGAETVALGKITTYNGQTETSSAVIISISGTKPVPAKTIESTFTDAWEIINALESGETTHDYYQFEATVIEIKEPFSSYNNMSFTIGAAAGATDVIIVYRMDCDQATADKVLVGATVVLKGKLQKYHSTSEDVDRLNLVLVELISVTGGSEAKVVEATVAEAIAACKLLEDNAYSSDKYKVTGLIKEVTSPWSSEYGNMSFSIVDAATDTEALIVFRLKCDEATSTTLVAGKSVTVVGVLQKYVKDETTKLELTSPELFTEGSGGGSTVTPKADAPLAAAVNFNFSTLTGKGDGLDSKPDTIKDCTSSTEVSSVSCTTVYSGNGQGGAYPQKEGLLKMGSSKANGSLTITLTGNANKVVVTQHDWYTLKDGYEPTTNTLDVNGVTLPNVQNTTGTPGELVFELETETNVITITGSGRCFIFSIEISYVAA